MSGTHPSLNFCEVQNLFLLFSFDDDEERLSECIAALPHSVTAVKQVVKDINGVSLGQSLVDCSEGSAQSKLVGKIGGLPPRFSPYTAGSD